MVNIVIGTTPTIRFNFSIVNPTDFTEAIFTINDFNKAEILRKTLDTATIGDRYIEWTLTQNETLQLDVGKSFSMMLNWLTNSGVRGVSVKESINVVDNHIREVM